VAGFFERLVVREAPAEAVLRPRLPSRFEPVPGHEAAPEADPEQGFRPAAAGAPQDGAVSGWEEVPAARQPPAAAPRRALSAEAPAAAAPEGPAAANRVEAEVGRPWPSREERAAAPRPPAPVPVATGPRRPQPADPGEAAATPMLRTELALPQRPGGDSPVGTGRENRRADAEPVSPPAEKAPPARPPVDRREEPRVAPRRAERRAVEPSLREPVAQDFRALREARPMAIRPGEREHAVAERRLESIEKSGSARRQPLPATVQPAHPMPADRPAAAPREPRAAPAVAVRTDEAEPRPAEPPALRPVLPERRRREMQRPEKPSVQITIGRIEVRAVVPPAAPEKRVAPAPRTLSLEDYLRQKSEGRS
jgi:hypothetical protein